MEKLLLLILLIPIFGYGRNLKISKQIGFDGKSIINSADFTIYRGERVGIIGKNGTGKTTLLKIIAGVLPADSGEVLKGSKVDMGYYDQHHSDLNLGNDIFEELVSNFKLLDEEARSLAGSFLFTEEEVFKKIGKLSGGERARVSLMKLMLKKPNLLILDEPTIGLDPGQIIEVRNIIKDLGKEHTVMLSTHILPEAQQVCDRVIIINKGQFVAEDSTERLQTRLTGAQRVHLSIRGDASEVLPVVSSTPGVINVSSTGIDSLEFESKPGEDVRSTVARNVISAGYDLLELKKVSMSLEDIFLELTRDEILPEHSTEISDSPEIEPEEMR